MPEPPPTRFARSRDARIAYQVVGDGPPLVVVGGPASHLDMEWELPEVAAGIERIAAFATVIRFDRRGTGLSDPVTSFPTLEQQMDDLQAVLDAVGVERTALMGVVDGGLCALYAATKPEAVTALILSDVAPSPPPAFAEGLPEQILDIIENSWGEGRLLELYAPSKVGDRRFEAWWRRYERAAVSPSMARNIVELLGKTDLRGVLPTIRVPTLVMHREGNRVVPVEMGRETAALIPGARFVEFPGEDTFWIDRSGGGEIEEFLTGRRSEQEPERVLATVLFTDIVNSTDRAAQLGDAEWRKLLDRHHALVREQLERFRGREIKTVGDGFVATFDGPARGVRCAEAAVAAVRDELGLVLRAGLHTGECELFDGDVGGIAVHIGARVSALAGGGEVLVSSTVKDLTVGSGLSFADRGVHELRGVPGEWRLYALVG